MHELSIAMSILDAVQEEVDRSGYGAVEAIHLRIGRLSGVVPQALQSAYELAAEQTPFASARLVIEEIPIVIHCVRCGRDQAVKSDWQICCAECETPAVDVVHGRELEVSALELAA